MNILSIKINSIFTTKVDLSKVEMNVIQTWISKKLTEILGFEDEVVINFTETLIKQKVRQFFCIIFSLCFFFYFSRAELNLPFSLYVSKIHINLKISSLANLFLQIRFSSPVEKIKTAISRCNISLLKFKKKTEWKR